MDTEDRDRSEMLSTVLDALPSLIFVVDDDVRIQDVNAAAAEILTAERNTILKRRGGEVLNCLHSKDVTKGCGHAIPCSDCVIRNSVIQAFHIDSKSYWMIEPTN
jgi:PAS domain-containing protein